MDSYTVNSIADGFWSIEDGHVRCFAFEGTKQALLIDTGFGNGDLAALLRGMTKLPPMLVNTHADGDHIGGNAQFEAAYMHPSEFAFYHGGCCAGQKVLPLWEGDVIDLGGRRLEVVLIPGHTPGSIALLDRENRLLIAGDSVQFGPIYMFGSSRNMPAYLSSMKKLERLSGLYDAVYASHGSLTVSPTVITLLREAAEQVLAGKVEGVEPEAGHRLSGKCRLFAHVGVSFWYAG
jgi:glyoxylase-like metal-dependent hydrolase (beta-lactamase superfamily II)